MAVEKITSVLWKVVQLVKHSERFQLLVQAAALIEDVPYSEDLLVHVASQQAVTNAIDITVVDGVQQSADVALERLLISSGAAVDTVIRGAVRAYTPPAS